MCIIWDPLNNMQIAPTVGTNLPLMSFMPSCILIFALRKGRNATYSLPALTHMDSCCFYLNLPSVYKATSPLHDRGGRSCVDCQPCTDVLTEVDMDSPDLRVMLCNLVPSFMETWKCTYLLINKMMLNTAVWWLKTFTTVRPMLGPLPLSFKIPFGNYCSRSVAIFFLPFLYSLHSYEGFTGQRWVCVFGNIFNSPRPTLAPRTSHVFHVSWNQAHLWVLASQFEVGWCRHKRCLLPKPWLHLCGVFFFWERERVSCQIC